MKIKNNLSYVTNVIKKKISILHFIKMHFSNMCVYFTCYFLGHISHTNHNCDYSDLNKNYMEILKLLFNLRVKKKQYRKVCFYYSLSQE